MSSHWKLDTHGDPLGTVSRFVRGLWPAAGLQVMILPPLEDGEARLLSDPAALENVNPFQPLMLMNTARLVPEVLDSHPNRRIGILLRPCEMRALSEVVRRENLDASQLVTICVDCLGTFPEDEFGWRTARKGSDAGLTREALQFAPQGGISAYRYRAACQMCLSPGATDGDVNIGVLGLPVRQTVLVESRTGRPELSHLTDGPADPSLVTRREQVLGKLTERHTRTRERVIHGLSEVLPADVEALLDQLENCGACQTCMDNCPNCAVTRPRQVKGRYRREDVVDWLASCAGCGMCEQACPQHLPLSIIFTHIKQQLEQQI